MKIFTALFPCQPARFIGGLLVVFFLAASASAQPAEHHQPGRFLFIFETSPTLKRSLPSVEKSLEAIFTNSLPGELRAGDEIGVWTVDDKLHTGQFPLTTWAPSNAVAFSTGLKNFLEKQSFRQNGNFAQLTTSLNNVAENSERLTVFIFCDGQTGISGTPFDDGVRNIFKESAAGQKKLRQPFIVVLRAQLGKFIACAVTLPPNRLNVPEFPSLPVKPAPVVVPVMVMPAPVVKRLPPVVVPSLIIIGTNISISLTSAPPILEKPVVKPPVVLEKTNIAPPQIAPVTNAPPTTTNTGSSITKTNFSMPPVESPIVKTNLAMPLAGLQATTNLLTNLPAPTAPAVKATAPETPPTADNSTKSLLAIGGAAILAAVVLVIILAVRSRRQRGSLITSSMNLPRTPPKQK